MIPFYMMGEPFVVIPLKLVEDKNSKGSDILVYLAIASFLHGRRWGATSQREIMRRAKYTSTKTVMKTITHLVEIGWAEKYRRGLTQTNIVILFSRKNERLSPRERKKIRDTVEETVNL